MKLQSFIKESYLTPFDKYDWFVDTVRVRCKPWLNAVKNCKMKYIKRGYKPKDLVELKNVRTERVPRDTPREIHTAIDVEFFKKFGWKARSESLFCFPPKISGGYGTENGLVFPVGNFKFLWAPEIRDFFLWYNKNYKPPGVKGSIEEFDYRKKWAWRVVEFYTNKNLCEALNSLCEIMIYCEKYIIIKKSFLLNMYNPPGNSPIGKTLDKFVEDVLIRGNV